MLAAYRPLHLLARGGMAELWLARAPDGSLAVLKQVLDHLRDEDDFVDRFEAEARLAMALDHPNVVRVYEVGEREGVPCIAMEWLDGLDVRALLAAASARGERLAPGVACAIAADAARGLHHAHTRVDAATGRPLGVVHRDVSPHNVFVTRAGAVKLLDFGIARSAMQLARSRTGQVRGKLGYMAPEQLAGLSVDARTDLFALGVTLWEMLAGRRLWKREDDAATARAIRELGAPPPSLELAGAALPRELDALALALLAKLPAGRPRDAALVAARLDALAAALDCASPRAALAALVARYAPDPAAATRAPSPVHGSAWDEETTV